jgi:hypothetical protein
LQVYGHHFISNGQRRVLRVALSSSANVVLTCKFANRDQSYKNLWNEITPIEL